MDDQSTNDFIQLDDDRLDELLASFRFDKDPAPPTQSGKTITIEGVPIEFPYKPYESQLQMMKHIICGVQRGENCLLESPTGTGKTAAILCSLLAWQRKCKEMGSGDYWALDNSKAHSTCTCNFDIYTDIKILQIPDGQGGLLLWRPAVENEDTRPGTPSPTKKSKVTLIPEETRSIEDLCGTCVKKHFKDSAIPMIYYATRTHSQITQVIKQLKVTQYSKVAMTILSSRQQTCINEEVLNEPPRSGIDHRCKILRNNAKKIEAGKALNVKTCSFYQTGPSGEFREIGTDGGGAWDIEDIIQHGKMVRKCPFYGCRELQEDAEIVFLPYNYLLSPSIRSSAKIRYPNSILVFDEAHNIEQICCDSLSITISLDMINGIKYSFDRILKDVVVTTNTSSAVQRMNARIHKLSNWLTFEGEKLPDEKAFDGSIEGSKTYMLTALIDVLKMLGFNSSDLRDFERDLDVLEGKDKGKEDGTPVDPEGKNKSKPFISPEHLSFFSGFLSVVKCIYAEDMRRLPDFRGSLEKKCIKAGPPKPKFEFTFNIYCMNAGIAFETLRDTARTIIVTSGTLSPTDSFASELETKFQRVLSANHVVAASQVWTGMLTTGLTSNLNLELNATCLRSNENVLDELGEIIVDICKKVPNGVLVFLPSYKTMERLITQWSRLRPKHQYSIMARLTLLKSIFYEESGQGNMDSFKESMRRYQSQVLVGNGAVLFAVFRGKVSEGVDFKDEQARAVVTIGIPYPYHGVRINLKKKYNDVRGRSASQFYLSGHEWYSAQAFRAMNQAFGRCLRHRHDWGAVILIDSRIPSNTKKLSAWVNKAIVKYDNGMECMASLEAFMKGKDTTSSPHARLKHDMTTQLIPEFEYSSDEDTTQNVNMNEYLTSDSDTTQVVNANDYLTSDSD